jgi:hypothetical protein
LTTLELSEQNEPEEEQMKHNGHGEDNHTRKKSNQLLTTCSPVDTFEIFACCSGVVMMTASP